MYSRNERAGVVLMKFKRQILALILMFSGLLGACSPVWAQIAERSAPSPTYFAIFREFYAGDYKNALEGFQSEARSCIKAGQSRWIDSICYETMIGECFYQMGMLDKALDHYKLALELAVVFPDWMIRVQFPQIRAAGQHRPYPWRSAPAFGFGFLSFEYVDHTRAG